MFHEKNTSIKIETRLHSVVVIVHLLSYVLQGTTVLMKRVFMLQESTNYIGCAVGSTVSEGIMLGHNMKKQIVSKIKI